MPRTYSETVKQPEESPEPTFSFGENWRDYLINISDADIARARKDVEEWLGDGFVAGKTVLDIGSGSGIHSLGFHSLCAESVQSFDYDEHSVEATRTLWAKQGSPGNWTVSQGSILNPAFLETMGQFDIVYSWGVLHHTGAMWEAFKNVATLLAPGGALWISLYTKGPNYQEHLELKTRYNLASDAGKRWMVRKVVARRMLGKIRRLQNPFAWNTKKARGMNQYHDIVDWLGGLPYEVADPNEVLRAGKEQGLALERIKVRPEGTCSIYLFSECSRRHRIDG